MIIDFRTLEDDALIETDLCVIGAGAAGITIAREFIGSGIRTCLVESGSFEIEDETQSLYQGESVGLPYADLDVCRLRFFGGTTNHWSGWCGPLSEIDFQIRSWVPYSGWPITRADLDSYYERAQPIVGLGPYEYGKGLWQIFGIDAPELNKVKVCTRFWQFSGSLFSPPVRFGEAFREELEAADNVLVLLHGNVINIQTNEIASVVESLDVRTLQGKGGRIKAKQFVIACGGIENPRLLLLSNLIEPHGLGNYHDVVGRFFMEHPEIRSSVVLAMDPPNLLEIYQKHWINGVAYRAGLCSGDEMQVRAKVLNSSATLDYEADPEDGTRAAQVIAGDIKRGRLPDHLGKKIWNVITDMDDVSSNLYRVLVEGKDVIVHPKLLFLTSRSEQAPNPNSRITLTEKRGTLGLNRARLDWRLTELDKRSVKVMTEAIGAEFGRLNLGRVRLDDWLLDDNNDWGPALGWGNHHLGTTRMSEDPKKGVVDKDCRVHSVENLYMAGSSVFPTGGFVNPTLTIVALALRLADRLRALFA